MKINYFAYFNPLIHSGGGEMIVRDLIEAGIRRSHDIAVTSVRPKRGHAHSRPDLIIFCDVFNFPHTIKSLGFIRRFRDAFLLEMSTKAPFVHFSNAYADVCNLPHLPCSGNASTICAYKIPRSIRKSFVTRDFSNRCFKENRLVYDLFDRAVCNVFLSPLHANAVYNILGLNIQDHPNFILKPTIDSKMFYNRHAERDIDYLFVGLIGEAKGLENMRRRFRGENFWLIGNIAPGAQLDFGKHIGFVSYKKIPEYMNRAKNFVFLPRWPEPQGRVVVEAALCGCNLIANENVGALSFDFDISNINNFANSCEEFWDNIEELV